MYCLASVNTSKSLFIIEYKVNFENTIYTSVLQIVQASQSDTPTKSISQV